MNIPTSELGSANADPNSDPAIHISPAVILGWLLVTVVAVIATCMFATDRSTSPTWQLGYWFGSAAESELTIVIAFRADWLSLLLSLSVSIVTAAVLTCREPTSNNRGHVWILVFTFTAIGALFSSTIWMFAAGCQLASFLWCFFHAVDESRARSTNWFVRQSIVDIVMWVGVLIWMTEFDSLDWRSVSNASNNQQLSLSVLILATVIGRCLLLCDFVSATGNSKPLTNWNVIWLTWSLSASLYFLWRTDAIWSSIAELRITLFCFGGFLTLSASWRALISCFVREAVLWVMISGTGIAIIGLATINGAIPALVWGTGMGPLTASLVLNLDDGKSERISTQYNRALFLLTCAVWVTGFLGPNAIMDAIWNRSGHSQAEPVGRVVVQINYWVIVAAMTFASLAYCRAFFLASPQQATVRANKRWMPVWLTGLVVTFGVTAGLSTEWMSRQFTRETVPLLQVGAALPLVICAAIVGWMAFLPGSAWSSPVDRYLAGVNQRLGYRSLLVRFVSRLLDSCIGAPAFVISFFDGPVRRSCGDFISRRGRDAIAQWVSDRESVSIKKYVLIVLLSLAAILTVLLW